MLALKYLKKGGANERFNLGNEQGSSVLKVIEAARKVAGREFTVMLADRRPGDSAVLVGSSEKNQETLGWEPRYTDISAI